MTTKRGQLVYSLIDNDADHIATDILDVWRKGNKRTGYAYRIVTFGDVDFQEIELTDEQRRDLIESLGGHA